MDFSAVDLAFAGALAGVMAAVTTPVGVSGAVFLLPVQLSVVGVPSPTVTPTNLVFNVVATPATLVRHARAGRLRGPLTVVLLAGTLPGVAVGALIRVLLVPDGSAGRVLVGALLVPLGLSLLLLRPAMARAADRSPRIPDGDDQLTGAASPSTSTAPGLGWGRRVALFAVACGIGVVGAMTGIGGGSIIAPLLLAAGLPARTVAGPALCVTFVASVAGVLAFWLLELSGVGPGQVGPIWLLGLVLGTGGAIGGWVGVRVHERLPERVLRRLLGLLAVTIGVRYLIGELG